MSKLSKSDQRFIMNTIKLEVSDQEGIDLSDLKIVRQEKKNVWFVARISTGRGIVRKFDHEL